MNDMIEKEKLIKLTLTGTGLETVLVLCTEFAWAAAAKVPVADPPAMLWNEDISLYTRSSSISRLKFDE